LIAVYCFLGALQNGSFAVAGAADPGVFHRNARIWFALAVIALAGAVLASFRAFGLRHQSGRRNPLAISGEPDGLYVDSSCCLTCGVPWTFAPSVFSQGQRSCLVRRQPSGATELRRVLRVFRSQELDCVRYGGRDSRTLAILRRAGCADYCDASC
jgi:hypothetical protein